MFENIKNACILNQFQDAIFGVLERDYEKVKEALKKSRCDINTLTPASQRRHILQHALMMKDPRLVMMLCDAGADVNIPIMIKNYFKVKQYPIMIKKYFKVKTIFRL